MRHKQRLDRLEASGQPTLGEAAKAWLGQRPPLTREELAVEPEPAAIEVARLSAQLRAWLGL